MKYPVINTRSIVIIGYCLLLILAITGFVIIYLEVIKSGRQNKDTTILKKELMDLSNTLTTMYQAEGTGNLLAYVENEYLKREYDSLTYRVFIQIDSLRFISFDPNIAQSLDTLSGLLSKKRENVLDMLKLMKQINQKNIVEEIAKRTIITRSDIDKLNTLLANVTRLTEDTVQVVAEKKGFLQRIRNVVKPDSNDTITQISKGSVSQTNELVSPIVTDTIIDFFRKIDRKNEKKNARLMLELIDRQRELYVINELTSLHINMIMDKLKEREYQTNMNLLREKNDFLKRSASLVAIIGLLALVVAVFFMSWTLQSLNRAQQLQKSIQKAKRHAEKLLVSREQLIYTITHDIKAPLSSIMGFLDLISEEKLSQKLQYYVKNMHSSASHILDLVRNLLDFNSIEKEQPQFATIAFLPSSLIRNIYESFLPLAQKKKLTFELRSTLTEKEAFLSDPYYIRQIVNNLLSNAIKFTPEHGNVFLITSLEENNQWKISVQDNGMGIDPADQARIFEEFFRVGKLKDEVEGTGLGLTISKKLAVLLGGTIDLQSRRGAGSVFTLTIPLTPAADNTIAQPDTVSSIFSGRILFVDDDRVQLNLLSELMKKEGWPCVCCLSAKEALDILQKQSFEIIFTDIHIPDMDGDKLVKRIRELDFPQATTIPVIAFSAGWRKPESELKAAGFNGFLLKPFKVNQLLEIIEKHTSFKRKTDEIDTEKGEIGLHKLINFATGDQEAALKIIDSFIEETKKDSNLLKIAFQKKNNDAIKQISHKMLSLMRMISAQDIISILTDFEKGSISKEKEQNLLHLLEDTIKEAESMRQVIDTMEIIDN